MWPTKKSEGTEYEQANRAHNNQREPPAACPADSPQHT
jgi:hypothetical protein